MAESTDAPIAKSDLMLRDALEALSLADSSLLETQIQPYQLQEFNDLDSVWLETKPTDSQPSNELAGSHQFSKNPNHEIRIELGRARIPLTELYDLPDQSLIVLDSPDHALVDLFAGDRLLAKGHVLCLDGRICFRVVELIS
jgi:flagellar motor switch/type III secretory pathway protein FliN